jgi:uroporphyrinogen-III synthase
MTSQSVAVKMDWIAFTSPMSSAVFFSHMEERFGKEKGDSYMHENVKVAAIGRPTAEELVRLGRPADLVPEKSTFRDLLCGIRDS